MGQHLKRLSAPKSWRVKRKGVKFITKPDPGTHPLDMCMPLNILLRDILGHAKTTKEVKKILQFNNILVDGVRRKDVSFPIGIMDTVRIDELQKNYRITLDKKGKIQPIEIDEAEANTKPCKIINKSLVKGRTQLNLFDGRNILVDKNSYKTGDTLILKVPEQEIKEHIKLENGVFVLLTKGKHKGSIGTVDDIRGNKTKYKLPNGEVLETLTDYVFVIGKDKPSIKVAEEAALKS